MSKKTQLRLMTSTIMSEKGENGTVRLSKRAREILGLQRDIVTIGKGPFQADLLVKHAYIDDIKKLNKMIGTGKISENQAQVVGFVSKSTYARVSRRKGDSIWITQGLGNITIGCDPEFGLINDAGMLCRAISVLPGSKKSMFGADGPGAEIRPKPSTDHLEVVQNINSILLSPPERAQPYHWIGGATFTDSSRVYWFGGHVHLGRPSMIDAENAEWVYERIADALDATLALPLVSFDTPNPNQRRNGCAPYGYGKAGVYSNDGGPSSSIRTDYPEKDRFEYRVLSGLWLVHPVLTRMVLGVSKCVAETAYGKLADKKFDLDWAAAPPSQAGLLRELGVTNLQGQRTIINRANPAGLSSDLMRTWEKQLRNLDCYEEYAAEVEALIELVKVSPEKVVPQLSLDIKKNWEEKPPLLSKAPVKLQKALEALT